MFEGSRGYLLMQLARANVEKEKTPVESVTPQSQLEHVEEQPRAIPTQCLPIRRTETAEGKMIDFVPIVQNCITSLDNQDQAEADFSSGSDELYEPSELEETTEDEDLSIEAEIETEVGIATEAEEVVSSNGEDRTVARKRKGQADQTQWKRQKNAQLRLKGKRYTGFKKNVFGKYEQTERKEEKSLRTRCNGHVRRTSKGGPKQNFECSTISEEDRKSIFAAFWKLVSWEAKKVYVAGCVFQERPQHRRNDSDSQSSRKKIGFKFYLNVHEGINNKAKKRVCKQMFLSTFGIGEKTVRSWVLDGESRTSPSRPLETEASSTSNSERSAAVVKNVKEFLNSLPKVESHYCRSSSSKLYLEPTWNSLREMHRHYLEKCRNESIQSASWKTFLNVVKKLNIDIYSPKKDQCNECTMHKNGNLDEETFQKHIAKKNKARSEKEKDKTLSTDCPSIQTYTVDLQAVLLSPRLNAAANYHKTKLKKHNFTYYNLCSKDVVCYVWHEASGGLESDVFASIATNYLQKEIESKNPNHLIIWSDGCGYQNRNVKLSNALLELSIRNNLLIEQKYLAVGHTQMEVDSIHATIEKKLGKRRELYVPADYLPIIQSARQNP